MSRSCAHCRPREPRKPRENTLFLFETRPFTRSEQSSEAGVIRRLFGFECLASEGGRGARVSRALLQSLLFSPPPQQGDVKIDATFPSSQRGKQVSRCGLQQGRGHLNGNV